jgi:hypothetical protein
MLSGSRSDIGVVYFRVATGAFGIGKGGPTKSPFFLIAVADLNREWPAAKRLAVSPLQKAIMVRLVIMS